MKRRALKIAALAAAGGVVLQLSTCAIIASQLLLQNLVSSTLRAFLSAILGGAQDTGTSGG